MDILALQDWDKLLTLLVHDHGLPAVERYQRHQLLRVSLTQPISEQY